MDFFVVDATNAVLLQHFYNPWLVLLSFLIATGGAALALYVVMASATIQSQRTRQVVLWAGAIAFGLAVWSMHFVGMLAFSLCAMVTYNTSITLLSIVPAILAARLVLHYVARKEATSRHLLLGGLVSGAGIGLMHYSGMMAMQLSADLRFDPIDFALSIVAAVVLATLALGARLVLTQLLKLTPIRANHLSALIMGTAITTMHYRGMAAARFIGEAETVYPVPPVDGHYLTLLVAMAMVSVLGLVASGVLSAKLKDSLAVLSVQGYELEAIIENATEAIVTTRADGRIKRVNRAFENMFGRPLAQLARERASTFLPQWPALLAQTAQQVEHETLGRRSDGSEFPIRLTLTRLETDAQDGYVGFIRDVSDVKRIQDQLLHDANHDFLTGLHNRRFFEEQLNLEFSRSERSKSAMSLIILDIDHFKRINDTFGHVVGDRVLVLLAEMLKRNLRSGDVLSRYGGEEFMLLLPHTDLITAGQVAERLRADAEKLELISIGKRIRFTISVGVACLKFAGGAPPQELIKEADTALYRAKNAGRNRVEVMRSVF